MKKVISTMVVVILFIIIIGFSIINNKQKIVLEEEMTIKNSQVENYSDELIVKQEQINNQLVTNEALKSELSELADFKEEYQSKIDKLLEDRKIESEKQFSYEDNLIRLQNLDKPFVYGKIKGMDIALLGQKWTGTDLRIENNYFFPVTMVKEVDDCVFLYQQLYEEVKLFKLNTNTLVQEKEIQINYSNRTKVEKNFTPTMKYVNDQLLVLLNDRIEFYDVNLELIKIIELPDFMDDYFGKTITRALDGRESISMYDISDDLETIVFSDTEGLKAYNRLAKTTKLLIATPEDFGENAYEDYYYYYLHPRFHGDKIVTEGYSGYIGFNKFYVYDLKTGIVTDYENLGFEYGYHNSLGRYFTLIGNEDEKLLLLYDLDENEIIKDDAFNGSMATSNGYLDGVNISVYNMHNYIEKDKINICKLYYYDYKTLDYMDKSLEFKDNEDVRIIAALKDNTAIILYSTNDGDYLVRF